MSGGWVFRFSILKSISNVIVQNHTVHCWNRSKSISIFNYFHLWWGEPALTTSRSIPVFRNFLHINWKMDVHKKGKCLRDIQLLQETIKNGNIYRAMDSTGPPVLTRKSTTANQKLAFMMKLLGPALLVGCNFFLFGSELLESQLNRSPCRSCNWFNKQWIYSTHTCPRRATRVACHPSQMIIETNWPTQST